MTPRAYTIKEIACAYFPYIQAKSASRRLKMWIAKDGILYKELLQQGYTPEARLLPWSCVVLIIKRFGTININ